MKHREAFQRSTVHSRGSGNLIFYHGENVVPDRQCDRLAMSNSVLVAASFVTTPTQMKAIRAILYATKGRVEIRASDFSAQFPSKSMDTYYIAYHQPAAIERHRGRLPPVGAQARLRQDPRDHRLKGPEPTALCLSRGGMESPHGQRGLRNANAPGVDAVRHGSVDCTEAPSRMQVFPSKRCRARHQEELCSSTTSWSRA